MFTLESLTADHFSWKAALALAEASKLSYESETIVVERARTAWGFDECRFIDVNETQAFIAQTDDVCVIVFRGTESLGDWIGNLGVRGARRRYGVVHSGFLNGYLAARTHILNIAGGPGGKKTFIAGHSLGGALAAICAAEEVDELNIRGVYTFGQPRTGRSDFAEFFADRFADRFFRIVNDDDVVPRVPPGYSHVGRLFHFDAFGEMHDTALEAVTVDSEPAPLTPVEFFELQREIKEVQLEIAVASEEALEAVVQSELLDSSVEGLFPSFSDHAIDRYIAAIRRQAENTAAGDTERALLVAAERPTDEPQVRLRSYGGFESIELAAEPEAPRIPVLIRLNRTDWRAPDDLIVNCRFGPIVSAMATQHQLQLLEDDAEVAAIEGSRDAGHAELIDSGKFVHADVVHRPPIDERGSNAIIGLIDTGIDVLHETFLDANGNSRILAVWNQRDSSPGRTPNNVDPVFLQNYGALYLNADIDQFISKQAVPPQALRDPRGHGTHVASIAAGRAVGSIADGMAPEAKLIVVIPNMKTAPGDPPSIGYSVSHFDALSFLKTAASGNNKVISDARPIAVNVSLGMNAGAHDGTSTLEQSFDSISTNGRDAGFVIIKSAGNERGSAGHARPRIAVGGMTPVKWESFAAPLNSPPRPSDYLEVWYDKLDELEFTLVDPANNRSPVVSIHNLKENVTLGGNPCELKLIPLHTDNGDNCLVIKIFSGNANIQTGLWTLEISGVSIDSEQGFVDLWIERDDARLARFERGQDEVTLSIPGTAQTVITVAACRSVPPTQIVDSSSKGRTRDGRPKPDLCAPGFEIRAALANQRDHQAHIESTGTSMAAPHVTGAVALALSRRFQQISQGLPGLSQLNARQIKAALIRSTAPFSRVHNEESGYGPLNIEKFLNRL